MTHDRKLRNHLLFVSIGIVVWIIGIVFFGGQIVGGL